MYPLIPVYENKRTGLYTVTFSTLSLPLTHFPKAYSNDFQQRSSIKLSKHNCALFLQHFKHALWEQKVIREYSFNSGMTCPLSQPLETCGSKTIG